MSGLLLEARFVVVFDLWAELIQRFGGTCSERHRKVLAMFSPGSGGVQTPYARSPRPCRTPLADRGENLRRSSATGTRKGNTSSFGSRVSYLNAVHLSNYYRSDLHLSNYNRCDERHVRRAFAGELGRLAVSDDQVLDREPRQRLRSHPVRPSSGSGTPSGGHAVATSSWLCVNRHDALNSGTGSCILPACRIGTCVRRDAPALRRSRGSAGSRMGARKDDDHLYSSRRTVHVDARQRYLSSDRLVQ